MIMIMIIRIMILVIIINISMIIIVIDKKDSFHNYPRPSRCFLGNVTINATEFTQENLEPYKEYQVNVSASLTSIGYTGSSSAAFVRTREWGLRIR